MRKGWFEKEWPGCRRNKSKTQRSQKESFKEEDMADSIEHQLEESAECGGRFRGGEVKAIGVTSRGTGVKLWRNRDDYSY